MITVFLVMLVRLSSIPVVYSTNDENNSTPTCPDSFSCSGSGTLQYPFYNVTDTHCGLIKVNCTPKGAEIEFGGGSYEISGKFDLDQNSGISLLIQNITFGQLLFNKSCKILMNNLTFPSSSTLLYSTSLTTFINLFKCTQNLTYARQTDAFFDGLDYKRYNECKDYNFYYNYLNGTVVPSNLPHTCQIVQLPVKLSDNTGLNETDVFSLLSYFASVEFELSSSCDECYKKGRRCDTENEHVKCSEAIKEKPPPIIKLEKQGRQLSVLNILAIVASALFIMLSFVIFTIWYYCKNKPAPYVSSKNKSSHFDDLSLSCDVSVFSYKELEEATQDFNPSNELGDGGFGAVYYGKFKDGREVAVKKLHDNHYKRVQQFINEVEMLTKLSHPNLVVLYGCTSRESSELLLVYEYVPNGTVADHLHGKQANPTKLTWPIRMKIAIETASALVYLHASDIIHRDVKTNNILLDHNFNVKVADFGLSRLIPYNLTHVSTAPQGTPGYVDPQYHQRYQLTDKSDVYSFGVVLIELISSLVAVDLNRSQDEITLANLALNKIQKGAVDQLVDPFLVSETNHELMHMITQVAELAFRCLQYDSDMRPTMKEVLEVLMSIQAHGGIEAYESSRNFQNMNVLPLSETNDAVVLLKDFRHSPVSVTEWQNNNSVSTTLSSNGDRLYMKNGGNT